jgi:hypothetical protein
MFSHILLPLDPPLLSQTTLMIAASLSTEHCAEITLLYMAEITDRKPILPFIGDARAFVGEFGSQPRVRIVHASQTGQTIKQISTEIGADLIVMDSRQRNAFDAYGGIPVLIVHEGRALSPDKVALSTR